MKTNKPKIVCFVCNFAFCKNEIELPSSASVARVNCIGRLDPVTIVEMFEKGVDAVMLAGCKPPDCHYVEGNIQAERAVKMLRKLLSLAGLEQERISLYWYSPMEEQDLENHIEEYSKEIARLAPLPLKGEKQHSLLEANIMAAKTAVSDFLLRVLLGREKELTEEVNVYGEKLSQDEFDELLEDIVETEFIRQKIHILTKHVPMSVKDLAEAVGMKPATVLKHIVNMRRKNMLTFDHIEGQTPLYKALEVA